MSLDIERFDDKTALRVLQILARAQPEDEAPSVDELVQMLPSPVSADVASSPKDEGDLARAALLWLAQDPEQRQVIESLATGPSPERYAFDPGLGAVVCVLLLLKTKAVIERDKNGRWRLKVELIELKDGPLGAVINLMAKLAKKN